MASPKETLQTWKLDNGHFVPLKSMGFGRKSQHGEHQVTTPINVPRLGIGGPVGSGKTALIERLVPYLQQHGKQVAIVTNDILTQEDAERLRGRGFLPPERI